MAVARLRTAQLSPALRAELDALLLSAWNAEPPLGLAPDAPTPPGAQQAPESSPTSLAARAAIARARDRLAGETVLFDALRTDYETLALPHTMSAEGVTLRAGLPPEALPALLAEVERVRAAFTRAVGSTSSAPLPGEDAPLTILIFARQGVYRDYVQAFTPFTVDVDGTYDEASATLLTHARSPAQSANTLEQTLRHELSHVFTGRALFAGRWHSPGYHAEPKGWFDEGLAELMAGLDAQGEPAPRPAQLSRVCAQPPPRVHDLLARREGYDRFGRFDYDGAWALSFFLLRERPDALQRIAAAYRDGSYRLAAWPRLVGEPANELEAAWHRAMAAWCRR
jgi:hypothetical protein